jgi:hypothetical protein
MSGYVIRNGRVVRVGTQQPGTRVTQQSGTPKKRPCGCQDVAAIARASAEIVGEG